MKSWIVRGVTVQWLPATVGVELREARVGEERIFGFDLSGPALLIWATEDAIKKLVAAAPKNATAKLVSEEIKLGTALPRNLPSLSGEDHKRPMSTAKIVVDKDGKPDLSPDREIGFEQKGDKKATVLSVSAAAAVPK